MKDECGDAPALPLFMKRSWAVAGELARPEAERGGEAVVTEGLELFQASPAAETDGYSAWKSAMAAEKMAADARRRSAELPVNSDEGGFARWKEEAEAAKRAFEQRWGVPLGKPVRVQLRGEALEREGVLRVAEEPAGKSAKLLRLTIAGHTFAAAQIESVVRV
ncbi:MAG: hypothetical protein JWR15_957 [Prosthecobacter sp.]|nr:hypothetical protein [Prosthecobacter sp.]